MSRESSHQGFIDAILHDPLDFTSQLVFADWLEERGDRRGELLRTVPSLLNVPLRQGLRPDCIDGFPGLQRPFRTVNKRAGASWRLLGIAALWRTCLNIAGNVPAWKNLFGVLARYQLYTSKLLTVKERDITALRFYYSYRVGHVAALAEMLKWEWIRVSHLDIHIDGLAESLACARSGKFNCFAEVMMNCESDENRSYRHAYRDGYANGPLGWSNDYRCHYLRGLNLDLIDKFVELKPWEAAFAVAETKNDFCTP